MKNDEKPASEKPAGKKPAAKKLAPLAWANELGHNKKSGRGSQARFVISPAYAAANAIYGWDKQAHHFGPDSFQISEQDFEAAMAAASKYPTVRPHSAALPRVSADKFAGFKPLKASKE